MHMLLLISLITIAPAFRVRHKKKVSEKDPSAKYDPDYDCNGDGVEECKDWDYGGARCANGHWCEYRYKFGDMLLDQSCRCKRGFGRPTEYDCDGDGNVDCGDWNYGGARCGHGHKCEYRYRFGDTLLDQSCRCKPECLGANLRACEDAATPAPTPAPTPYPTLAPTPEGGCGFLGELARRTANYALSAALRGRSPVNVSLHAGPYDVDLWLCELGLELDASMLLSGFEDAQITEIDCGTWGEDSVTFGARLSFGQRVEAAGALRSNWSICGLDLPNETGVHMGVITEDPGLHASIRLEKTSIPFIWKIAEITAFDLQLGQLDRFTCGLSGVPDFLGSIFEQWCVNIITWLAEKVADYLDQERMTAILQSLIDQEIEEQEPQDFQEPGAARALSSPQSHQLAKPRARKPPAVSVPKAQECGTLGGVARQAVNRALSAALSGKSPLAVSLHAGQWDINLWGCTLGLEVDAGLMLSGFEGAHIESMDCESGGAESMTFTARMSFGQSVEATGAVNANWSLCGSDYSNATEARMGVVTADPGLRVSMRLAKTSVPYIWTIAAIDSFEIQVGTPTSFTCGFSGVPDFIGSRLEAWCVSIIGWIVQGTTDGLDVSATEIFSSMIGNQLEELH